MKVMPISKDFATDEGMALFVGGFDRTWHVETHKKPYGWRVTYYKKPVTKVRVRHIRPTYRVAVAVR